tara:strand:+ start:173 stop:553 length:381 start_codon:yes stop_codon:yes gene_type:complete
MYELLMTDLFEMSHLQIKVTDEENILLKRLSDGTVIVSCEDLITGSTTILASYKNARWVGYNATNYAKFFSVFRTHKQLKSKLIKFLTPSPMNNELREIRKVFTCAKKRIVISIKSATRSTKRSLQ